MSFRASRRRFLALAALTSVPAAQTFAGTTPSATMSAGHLNKDVGSWHVVELANDSNAYVRDAAIVTTAGSSPDKKVQGSADLQLQYWSLPGHLHGFTGTLTVQQNVNMAPTREAKVFVDGTQVDDFTLGSEAKRDVAHWFNGDISGLQKVKTIKVTLADDSGGMLTIYEAHLAGTAKAMTLMRVAAEQYYFKSGQAVRDAQKANSGGSQDGCFLTTTCCELVGLPDDCFELTTLRRFRDTVMMRTADGRADVRRYYAEAPAIVEAIRRRGDQRVLLRLYFTHVLPSALAARFGLERTARRLYADMMERLAPYRAG